MTEERRESMRIEESAYEDTIDLAKYLLVLWRHRLVIVLGTLLFGLAAFVWGKLTPPTYEATAKLLVSPPKTGEVNDNAPLLSIASFRLLVENQSLGAKIVEEFGLNKEPYRLNVETFMTKRVKVETVRDTNVVLVKVRLPNRDLAARVANRIAQGAEDLAQQLNRDETVSAQGIIKAQLDQSRRRLEQAERNLESFKREAQMELLRKDVDALLGQRGTLLGLLVEIQTEKARLSQAEALLGNRVRIDTLKRSIDTDPAAMESARTTSSQLGSVLPLQLRNEFVNPVYENLDQVIAASRTRLAGLEKQKTELIDVRRIDADKQAKLSLLYQRETELARLQTEYEVSRTLYLDVCNRYEQTRIQVVGRSSQLQVMDSALPPDRPVSPRVLRNTAIALVLGFVLMVIGVLLYGAVGSALMRETAL
jgi:succinoglycan biosynthesis transport protein ExoP